jgi:hypothetical protein
MKSSCPYCHHQFLPEDINKVTDLALCPSCGRITQLSEPGDEEYSTKELPRPPKGAWYRATMSGCVFGATLRSADVTMWVLLTIAVSFFLYFFLGVQFIAGKFIPLLTFIGIPVLLVWLGLVAMILITLCGKVEVCMKEELGTAFIGVGKLGWRRSFNLDELESIENGITHKGRRGSEADECIVLRGKKLITFGRMLSGSHQHFMVKVLRQIKARRSSRS